MDDNISHYSHCSSQYSSCFKIHLRRTTVNLLHAVMLFIGGVWLTGLEAQTASNESSGRAEQRQTYADATKALARGDHAEYQSLRSKLLQYPLLPYLDYADLSTRNHQLQPEDIDQYLLNYPDVAARAWLLDRWLGNLAAKRQWSEFITYYDSDLKSTGLACQYAYAQYAHGDRGIGLAAAKKLWSVGKSQPEACDPVFEKLATDNEIDDDLAWTRFMSAVTNREFGLANYITRFFSNDKTRSKGALYLSVERNPDVLANYAMFSENTADEHQIIYQGLTRLAYGDASLALKLWNRYHQSHNFAPEIESDIIGTLIKSLYVQGQEQSADSYLVSANDKVPTDILDWRLREIITTASWQKIIDWSDKLSQQQLSEPRLKYWRARALVLTGQRPEVPGQLYEEIRHERSYYGFLASEWLNQAYDMQHEPAAVSDAEIIALGQTPTFQRIHELYYHGELTWARREWERYLNRQKPHQWLVAARLADQWGWYNQAIMSMIQVQYWNDINVRFPTAFAGEFQSQATATSIPVNLLLALSRQESAFNETVTSSAGAKGLMQLMPATAKETARKNNIRYSSTKDLENPATNILIGSRYYRQVLDRFNNNRILATAAYNAGPHRVTTWLNRSQGTLPFDAWIEVIPFKETRNYVQNVLAFSIIYAHHLGLDVDILSAEEKNRRL